MYNEILSMLAWVGGILSSQVPFAAWIGYVHMSRPSRKECEERHKSGELIICEIKDDIKEIKDSVKENNKLIIQHITMHNGE